MFVGDEVSDGLSGFKVNTCVAELDECCFCKGVDFVFGDVTGDLGGED